MIQDGDILLCKGDDLIARLIRWGTRSQYSHVAIVASANLGLIIEAIPTGGVRAISVENYNGKYDIYRVKPEYTFKSAEVTAYLVKMLARGYDFKSVAILVWKMLLRRLRLIKLLGLKILRNKDAADSLQENQDYFCSELCYKAFFFGGGLDIVPDTSDGETTSPGDIAKSRIIQKI